MLSPDMDAYGLLCDDTETESAIESHLSLLTETTTNIKLLALNASIEALHATAFLDGFSGSVGDCLLSQAYMVSLFAELCGNQELVSLAMESGLCDYAVADGDGVVTHSDNASIIGARIDEPFSRAINSPESKIVSCGGKNADGRRYIAAARAGAHGVGAVKLGTYFTPPSGARTIDSFKVVAIEVKNQADSVKNAVDAAADGIRTLLEAPPLDRLEKRRLLRSIQNSLSAIIRITKVISLLGVRAKIEAAQMTNDRAEFDKLMNVYMTLEARLMARLFAVEGAGCPLAYRILENTGIGIWITDGNGTVEITNSDGDIGFAFTNEGTTAPFYPILSDPNYVAAPPPVTRAQDGKTYKFVGVGRLDKHGIVQVGIPSEIFKKSSTSGFTIVATEIREMADRLSASAEKLSSLVSTAESVEPAQTA